MDNKKKKDLAKIALAAFMLSASLPAAVNANTDVETQGTLLAGGGCAAASTGNRPASGSCGASSGRYSPSTSGCGASQGRNSPATSGCGASQGRYSPATSGCGASQGRYTPATSGCGASQRTSNNAPATHGCGAATGEETPPPPPKNNKPNVRPNPVAMGNQTRSAGNMGNMDDSGASSYQGTTTGPGPNDGYPGAPKGSYNVNQKPGR